jgi:hypothetical protein
MLTVVLRTDNSRVNLLEQIQTAAAVALVLAITYGLLLLADPISRAIGAGGANVIKRVMDDPGRLRRHARAWRHSRVAAFAAFVSPRWRLTVVVDAVHRRVAQHGKAAAMMAMSSAVHGQ